MLFNLMFFIYNYFIEFNSELINELYAVCQTHLREYVTTGI